MLLMFGMLYHCLQTSARPGGGGGLENDGKLIVYLDLLKGK